jgi:hypothetical protein
VGWFCFSPDPFVSGGGLLRWVVLGLVFMLRFGVEARWFCFGGGSRWPSVVVVVVYSVLVLVVAVGTVVGLGFGY